MNVREQLQRAQRLAPPVEPDLERLHRRRERRARTGRIGTAVLALVIGFGAIGGAWWAFRGESGATQVAEGPAVGPPTTGLAVGQGDYYYLRVKATSWTATGSGLEPDNAAYETWWATDDSGRIHNIAGSWYDEGVVSVGAFRSDTGDVSGLSTDPAELEAQLRIRVEPNGASPEPYAEWGGPVEWGLIRSIRELLMSADVTPAQKAALVQVAANLDGVTVDDRAVDPAGRAAILLSTHTESKLTEWWFDPASHQLMAMREAADENGEHTTFLVEAAGIAKSTDTDHLVREFVPPAG
jgi:hypothetical protein